MPVVLKPAYLLTVGAAALLLTTSARTPLTAQVFATNTPVPGLATGALTGSTSDVQPLATADASLFATNTLDPRMEPTDAPTLTLTPTGTPTATLMPTQTPTYTASPSPTPVGPNSYPDGISSLTGLAYSSEEAMNRRNILIKVSNYPAVVRPQSGLNQADVVYEYEVEGGVTRFAAIFRDNAPRHVGPVRSGRLMDTNLVPMYEAIFSYSGASAPVQQLFFRQPWSVAIISPSIGDNCVEAGFCRFPADNLAYEHTMYADTVKIWERATARGINNPYRARGFAFGETPDPNGLSVNDLYIDWYGQTDARWQWDEVAQHWVRFTDGTAHYDALDGQQIWADNVIVIEVPHEERPDLFEEESHSASQQIDLWGQGRAYLLRDSQYYQGFWRRPCDEPPESPTATPEGYTVTSPCGSRRGTALQLVYGANTPMLMRPGRTWVEVVRYLGDITLSDTPTNMAATMTVLSQSATPTFTITAGPSRTPEATLSTPIALTATRAAAGN